MLVASAAVLKVATPPDIVVVPSVELPSLKVTETVGAPAVEVTVAVIVTVCPKVEGLLEDVRERWAVGYSKLASRNQLNVRWEDYQSALSD